MLCDTTVLLSWASHQCTRDCSWQWYMSCPEWLWVSRETVIVLDCFHWIMQPLSRLGPGSLVILWPFTSVLCFMQQNLCQFQPPSLPCIVYKVRQVALQHGSHLILPFFCLILVPLFCSHLPSKVLSCSPLALPDFTCRCSASLFTCQPLTCQNSAAVLCHFTCVTSPASLHLCHFTCITSPVSLLL